MCILRFKYNAAVRIISATIIVLFLVNDIVWANPDAFNNAGRSTLQPPLYTRNMPDTTLIETAIKVLQSSFGAGFKDLKLHLYPNIDNRRVDLFFDRRTVGEDAIIVPCVFNNKPYAARINLKDGSIVVEEKAAEKIAAKNCAVLEHAAPLQMSAKGRAALKNARREIKKATTQGEVGLGDFMLSAFPHYGLSSNIPADKLVIIEIAKLCAGQNGGGTALYFKKFHLDPKTNKEVIIEIAKLCARQDGYATAKHIDNFSLDPKTDKDAIIEIAKLCARQSAGGAAEHFKNFSLDPNTDKEAIIEIAKLCARQDGLVTAMYFNNFSLDPKTDILAIIDIMKVYNGKHPEVAKEYFDNFIRFDDRASFIQAIGAFKGEDWPIIIKTIALKGPIPSKDQLETLFLSDSATEKTSLAIAIKQLAYREHRKRQDVYLKEYPIPEDKVSSYTGYYKLPWKEFCEFMDANYDAFHKDPVSFASQRLEDMALPPRDLTRLDSGNVTGANLVSDTVAGTVPIFTPVSGTFTPTSSAFKPLTASAGRGIVSSFNAQPEKGAFRTISCLPGLKDLRQTLEGHTGIVWSISILPDGRIVSGSDDKTLKIWDLTNNTVDTLEGHTDAVTSVSILPDGRIVSGSRDKTLKIWDLTNNTVDTLEGHTYGVYSISILPDGRIVSGSGDRTLKIWDLTNNTVDTLKGHTDGVRSVSVLPDGRIVSGSYDNTLKIWDLTNNTVETLEGHTDTVWSISILPDGRIVSGSRDNTLKIWDLTNNTVETLEGHTGTVWSISILPDGRIVSGSLDKTLKIWDLTNNTVETLEGHTDAVTSVSVLPDGRIVSGSGDRTLKIWQGSASADILREDWAIVLRTIDSSIDERIEVSLGSSREEATLAAIKQKRAIYLKSRGRDPAEADKDPITIGNLPSYTGYYKLPWKEFCEFMDANYDAFHKDPVSFASQRLEDMALPPAVAVRGAQEKSQMELVPLETNILRDISSTEMLVKCLKEGMISRSFDKKLVLAFDKDIALYQSENPLRRIMQALKELKEKEAYKKILSNLVIVSASADALPEKLKDHLGDAGTQVMVFARADAETRSKLSSIGSKARAVYIDESAFKSGAYYPLAEIVVLALAQNIENIIGTERGAVSSINIDGKVFDLSTVNIKEITNDGAALIFSLLPAAKEHETQELIRKYAAILPFLESA